VKNGVGFRARGEEGAYQAHAPMYTPLARRALASETRGQNSWVNYGPHGEHNRTANAGPYDAETNPDGTYYADQKTTLLPSWVSEEGRLSAKSRKGRFELARSNNSTGYEGAFTEDGRLELTHFSRNDFSRTDPKRWGDGFSSTVSTELARKDAGAPPQTFFGITKADENPYRREWGVGAVEYTTTVDPELIYPARDNPDGLWRKPQPDEDKIQVLAENEQRIKDAGYMGYYANSSVLGKVVVVFDELEVQKALTQKSP
jgi:hypothetical protein